MVIFDSIIINSSFVYLIFFFLISFLLSYILYRRHTGLLNVPRYLVISLFVLRFLSFFLLFVLLLHPEFKNKEKIIEKPLVVLLQDNSKSIILNKDSLYYKSDYLLKLDSLSNNVNIDIISFDDIMKKQKPDFLIVHLISSLPLTIFYLFNFKTKLILHVAGHPKLNFFRKSIWKISSKRIFKVVCPSQELKQLFLKQWMSLEKLKKKD